MRILNSSDKGITLFPRCRVAELSKPTVIVPREVVSVEEVNGEVYVRKVSRGEVKSVEGTDYCLFRYTPISRVRRHLRCRSWTTF